MLNPDQLFLEVMRGDMGEFENTSYHLARYQNQLKSSQELQESRALYYLKE